MGAMRIAYFDCFSGIAGDMILGALVGCGLDIEDLRSDLAGLALDGFRLEHRQVRRGALGAVKVDVVVDEIGHPHRGLEDIRKVLEESHLPDGVAEQAGRVFKRLVEAEGSVHGVPADEVHLHDVGAVDAIVDVVGACAGLQRLGIDKVLCSSLNVGGGTVQSAHGELPVPAPATAYLLRGAPVYSRGPQIELVTPTGAALMATLAESYGPWPEMVLDAVGYGAGDHELDGMANILRLAIGDHSGPHSGSGSEGAGHAGPVSVIETNLDDITPQILGSVIPRLLDAGALDAYTVPIFMKKNRPGVQLTVLSPTEHVELLADLIFRETTTLGLRTFPVKRHELRRRHEDVDTPWGRVRVKVAKLGESVVSSTPEYEDCEAISRTHGVPLKQVILAAASAFLSREETSADTDD
jgi:uncharacterized protein (TIGR00299 family) protein